MPRWDCVNTRQREPAEGAGTRLAHPSLSSPDGADWRKNARLFAYSPRVQCRDGLAAGGEWIRTFSSAILIMLRRPAFLRRISARLSKELDGFQRTPALVKATGR